MAESKGSSGRSESMAVDAALVRELAELLNETGLTEIEVEDGERKIRVSRGAVAASAPVPVAAAAPAPGPAAGAPAEQLAAAAATDATPPEHRHTIKSPMVGTAFLFPEPGADPFVRKGDRVKPGDTLLIVEAMKVMNPIAATQDGIVEEILIENAQPVEFDQPLVVLG